MADVRQPRQPQDKRDDPRWVLEMVRRLTVDLPGFESILDQYLDVYEMTVRDGKRREHVLERADLEFLFTGQSEAAQYPQTERVKDAMPDDVIDAKVAAAEARTDTKFAMFSGRLDTMSLQLSAITKSIDDQRSEARANRTTMIVTTIVTGVAVIGTLVAMLSYGATAFYNGTVMRDAVNNAVIEHSEPKK